MRFKVLAEEMEQEFVRNLKVKPGFYKKEYLPRKRALERSMLVDSPNPLFIYVHCWKQLARAETRIYKKLQVKWSAFPSYENSMRLCFFLWTKSTTF